jgi:D-alanyl-D-alanine carboxypeptidase
VDSADISRPPSRILPHAEKPGRCTGGGLNRIVQRCRPRPVPPSGEPEHGKSPEETVPAGGDESGRRQPASRPPKSGRRIIEVAPFSVRKKRRGLLLFLPLAVALCACGSRSPVPFPSNLSAMPVLDSSHSDNPVPGGAVNPGHPDAEQIESIASKAVADGIPGIVLLIQTPNDGTWVSARGFADLKNKIPMRPNSLSRIGSITKMFTAVIIHQWIQEGQFALDDPISKLLPESATRGIRNADRATVRQLLNHTSGIANYTDYLDIGELYRSGTNEGLTPEKALDLVRGLPADFPPGTGCHYSNTNYILLGIIAEAAAGKTLRSQFQERIFSTLGLRSTYFDPDLPVQRGVARGYADYPPGNLIDTTDFDQATRTADGGIVSTVFDMAAFLRGLAAEKQLLSEIEYSAMLDDPKWNAGLSSFVGLGILVITLPNKVIAYGYSGGHFGYTAELWYVPATQTILAYLINGSSEIGTHVQVIQEVKEQTFMLLAGGAGG